MSDKYSGMTVNERLYASGKMAEFDNAIKKREVSKLEVILREVEVDEVSIQILLEKHKLK